LFTTLLLVAPDASEMAFRLSDVATEMLVQTGDPLVGVVPLMVQ